LRKEYLEYHRSGSTVAIVFAIGLACMSLIGCATATVTKHESISIVEPESKPATVPLVEPERGSYLDAVRWWNKGDLALSQLGLRVPIKKDPKIIVMMYHNLVFGRTGGEYNRDIYNFEQDLVFLRNRTKIIGLDNLPAIKDGAEQINTDVSVITFDDGDLSIYAIAFPLLKQYDVKATFFVITDFVGQTGYVSWDQLKEMAEYRNERGERLFTIGSHSLDHRRFDEIPEDEIPRELSESKAVIERNTGFPVEFFALPFGAGVGRKEIVDAAKAAGYVGIRSSDWKALTPKAMDMFNIPAYYVSNERSDILVGNLFKTLGR
jgi:peptidoglycan/xylan/chitin deacetylase (PgdA/CDA1 family)